MIKIWVKGWTKLAFREHLFSPSLRYYMDRFFHTESLSRPLIGTGGWFPLLFRIIVWHSTCSVTSSCRISPPVLRHVVTNDVHCVSTTKVEICCILTCILICTTVLAVWSGNACFKDSCLSAQKHKSTHYPSRYYTIDDKNLNERMSTCQIHGNRKISQRWAIWTCTRRLPKSTFHFTKSPNASFKAHSTLNHAVENCLHEFYKTSTWVSEWRLGLQFLAWIYSFAILIQV